MGAEEEAKALAKRRGRNVAVRVVAGKSKSLPSRVQKELGPSDPRPSEVEERVDFEQVFANAGAIEPPYPPDALVREWENSNVLRQNVDAYAQNIDGFGWRFEPTFDFQDDDIDEQVADAVFLDMKTQALRQGVDFDENFVPTPEMIEETKRKIQIRMRRELAQVNLFFGFCCADRSFTELRKDSRLDQEVLGHSWWEALRDQSGKLAAFSYVPSFTIRAVSLADTDVVEREMPVKRSPLRWGKRRQIVRARRWVQVIPNAPSRPGSDGAGPQTIYFKEFGDPRLVSNISGAVYPDIETMRDKEPEARPATELIQFRIHTPRSGSYGVPRWIGNLKSVVGSRQAESINLAYFDNKSVPPLALLVSGGSLTEEAVNRIEDYVENEIKGEENFHKILIIEAEPAGDAMDPLNSGKVRVELVPLTKAIHNDALFMNYIRSGRDWISESFRNPKVVRGATDQINRATAEAAIDLAESQVYGPERQAFDWWINRFVMSDLGILFWEFRSNSPVHTDLDAAKAIHDLTKVGLLTPREGRRLASRVFNIDLRRIDAQWVNQPLQLTLAGILMSEDNPDAVGNGGTGTPQRAVEGMMSGSAKRMLRVIREARKNGEDPVSAVEDLLALRAQALDEERRAAIDAHARDKEAEIVTLKVPGSIDRYFTRDAGGPSADPE